MVRIGVVGASYRHATAEQVARFAVPKAELLGRLPGLRAALQGAEVLYLATCNRVEVVFVQPEAPVADLRPQVFAALLGREPRGGEASAALRAWMGEAAIEHLFLVACGLDSAQAGEQEIYVQLRAAWQAAREARTTGPLLDRIVSEALGMARYAHRLQTHHAPSLADLAAQRLLAQLRQPAQPQRAAQTGAPLGSDDAREGSDGPLARPDASTAGDPRDAHVALIGVSPMTRRCGARLAERGVPLLVVNRTLDAAQELAQTLSARAMSLDAFRREPPPGCGALLCATGAAEPVLDAEALGRLSRCTAAGRPPLIVDLGLPPNVDPDTARAAGFERIGMDDLVRTAREARVEHLLRLAPVRAAIDERLGRLRSELAARAIGPQLAQLREDFERIAAAEVDRLLSAELQDLDAARRARVAEWGTTLARRLAHLPLSGLRAAAEHASAEVTDAFFREARLRRTPLPLDAGLARDGGPPSEK